MTRTVRKYANPHNNGSEIVIRDGNRFFISSYFSRDYGWTAEREVSRQQITDTMRLTCAPESVVSDILAD